MRIPKRFLNTVRSGHARSISEAFHQICVHCMACGTVRGPVNRLASVSGKVAQDEEGPHLGGQPQVPQPNSLAPGLGILCLQGVEHQEVFIWERSQTTA